MRDCLRLAYSSDLFDADDYNCPDGVNWRNASEDRKLYLLRTQDGRRLTQCCAKWYASKLPLKEILNIRKDHNNMTFLINCSNLKNGGGLQVADSICCQLARIPQHRYVVVLSKYLKSTRERIGDTENVEVYEYDIPNSLRTIVLGRDAFLDDLVAQKQVDAVLTVFGPSRWRPRVPHLSVFALPQLVIPESPYFQKMTRLQRTKWWLWCRVRQWSLKRSADAFWTENPYISRRVERLFKISPTSMGGVVCRIKKDWLVERRAA